MSDQTTRHDHPDPGERLDSWKAIASYLNRDVTTVQRWEKRESMPVHRHLHDKLGSVYAFRSELDAWVRSRKAQPGPAAFEFDEGPLRPAPATRRWPWLGRVRARPRDGMGRSTGARSGHCPCRVAGRFAHRIGHGLRRTGTGGRDFARRAVRRISVGPRRAAGRVGESSRVRVSSAI